MDKIYDIYKNYVSNVGGILEDIDFNEFLKVRMLELREKGFDVECSEVSVDKALEESEEIWYSKKINKVTFMPGSLKVNSNEAIDEIIINGNIKDIKNSNWKSLNIKEENMEVKTLKSNININSIIDKFDKLKIKDGYTLQIYKVKCNGMCKIKLIAFKNIELLPEINTENLILNDYEILNIEFKQGESSYLNAIEAEESPDGYLQLVLLNNKINEICNSDDKYEIIDRRTVIGIDGKIVEAPNFYYDQRGNCTIEYFKKYNTYNGAYKRVINTFSKDTWKFKIVEQIVALYMN